MIKPALGTVYTAKDAMKLAIDLASLGANRVSPNPHVGCVVLDKSYKLISTGYHEKYSEAHAEVNALKGLSKADLEGAHVFVTLEPCSHHGKTPPCADYVASFPIESLTYGIEDPNPQVAGRGLDILRAKGIRVHKSDDYCCELEGLLLSFRHHLNTDEAFFALKVAASIDGVIADENRKSQWITGEESRQHVHFLRSKYHAILIGKGSLVADNPKLNVRHPWFEDHENKVLVLNASGDLIDKINEFEIYKIRKPQDIYIITEIGRAKNFEHIKDCVFRDPTSGIIIIGLEKAGENSLHLKKLKEILPSLGIYDVFVEGGAIAYSEILKQQIFDFIYLFQAPIVLGTERNLSWTNYLNKNLADKIPLKILRSERFGDDNLIYISRD